MLLFYGSRSFFWRTALSRFPPPRPARSLPPWGGVGLHGFAEGFIASLGQLPGLPAAGEDALLPVGALKLLLAGAAEKAGQQRPHREHRRGRGDIRPQLVLLGGFHALGAGVVRAQGVAQRPLAEQVNVADGQAARCKIVEQAAVVEIHRGIALLLHVAQKGEDLPEGCQLFRWGQPAEALPGGELPGGGVALKVPVVKQAVPLRPLEDRHVQLPLGEVLHQADEAWVGQPLVQGEGGTQVLHRLGGGEAAVSSGGPSHLEEKPPLPLAHPKADVAGIVLGEHLEHAAVGLEKGKVAHLFHGERDAVDGLLCHTCLLKDGEGRCTAAPRWVVGRAGSCIQPPLHSSTCCL